MSRPTHQNSVEFSGFVKFRSDFMDCHHRGEVLLQPTRQQFKFVFVAEEQQDEETQGGDDGQHGNDDTGRRRSCKTQQKKTPRGSRFTVFTASSTFNGTSRLTRYMRSTYCIGLGAARLDFFSALSLAAAGFVFCGRTNRKSELKEKLAHVDHFFSF